MTPTAQSRREAAFLYSLWQRDGAFPNRLLTDSVQRGFVMNLLYTAIKHKASLEWMLKQCVKRLPQDELLGLLMIGAVQLVYRDEVPDHAALYETVEAAKLTSRTAASFVNGTLRTLARRKDELSAQLADKPLHLQLDHPKALVERWVATFGEAGARTICAYDNQSPVLYGQWLPPYGEGAFVIPHGSRVEETEGYAEGRFVVQDPATQFAIQLLDAKPGARVLDACAAPGGKTAQIAARLRGTDAHIVAADCHEDRLVTLRDTLQRCQLLDAVDVRQHDATRPFGEPFDFVLLDVPCSNSGVLGRRPDARWRWSLNRMAQRVADQRQILDAISQDVAPGGRLVYSTCSLEPDENGLQVQAFLAGHSDFTFVAEHLASPLTGTDGAYAAAFQRRG